MDARHAIPSLALAAAAAVLYSRAGYGPFGDPMQRKQPCTADRCVHNASILALIAAATVARSEKRHGWRR